MMRYGTWKRYALNQYWHLHHKMKTLRKSDGTWKRDALNQYWHLRHKMKTLRKFVHFVMSLIDAFVATIITAKIQKIFFHNLHHTLFYPHSNTITNG